MNHQTSGVLQRSNTEAVRKLGSEEISRESLLRAERRMQEMKEAVANGILQEPFDGAYLQNKFGFLYQARPARNVYTSPLIQSNRRPLWESPPLSISQSDCSNQSISSGMTALNSREESAMRRQRFQRSLIESPTDPLEMTSALPEHPPSPTVQAAKIYPCLPRFDSNENMKNDSKDFKNIVPKPGAHSKTLSKDLEYVKSSSDVLNGDYLSAENDVQSCINSEDDIEDSHHMDSYLEEALSSETNFHSTMIEEMATDHTEESFCNTEMYHDPDQIHTADTLRSTECFEEAQFLNENQKGVNELLREAETQQQIMAQASKALTICRSSKNFCHSSTLVDAERLLLLATLRNTAILDKVRGVIRSPPGNLTDSGGQLCILEVSAAIKEDPLKWGVTDQDKDLWFLCVLCYGQQILSSNPVAYEPGAKSIAFPCKMELFNLPTSFVASLQIYTLRTYKPQQPTQMGTLRKACKLLRRRSKSCLFSVGSEQLLHLRSPAFALSGSASIDLSKVNNSQPQNLILGKVPLMSPLKGSVWVRMKTSLTSSACHRGFLTIFEKAGGSHAWQRKWCLLKDQCLLFWNYPADQEEKEPLQTIDLRDCLSEKVGCAPRHLCARPRTLMLEAIRPCAPDDLNSTVMECNKDFTVIRYFLSCDSVKDMNEWTSILSEVLSSIKVWETRSTTYITCS